VRECVAGRRTGIGSYVANLVDRWRQDTAVVSPVLYGNQRTVLPTSVAQAPVRVINEHATLWWDQVSLARALGRDRVDVFLSPYYKAPLAAPCPVVVTIHDLLFLDETIYPATGRRRLGRIAFVTAARAMARRAALVIADSEHSRAEIERWLGVPRDKLRVVPVGLTPALGRVDDPAALARVRATYGVAGPYVLYVGNFKPHKNLARLVRAWAAVPEATRGGHQLVLAGTRDEHTAAVEALAHSLGLESAVRCPGFVADADLAALYSGATALALPSLAEGFGVPVTEAMACGTPVLCSGTTSLAEVAGDAALLVEPSSEASIAGGLHRLLTDPELQRRLVTAGLRRIEAFSLDRTGAAVEAVLIEAARTGGA
jgi:glycosyltransferase involved in cell wall biosynthesis